jgi:hypothetical protein
LCNRETAASASFSCCPGIDNSKCKKPYSAAVRGVDRPAPPTRPPDIPGGGSGFRIPSETGDSEGDDPGYNLLDGGGSDQDGSMEVDFH